MPRRTGVAGSRASAADARAVVRPGPGHGRPADVQTATAAEPPLQRAGAPGHGSLPGGNTRNKAWFPAEARGAKAGGRDPDGRRRGIETAPSGRGIADRDVWRTRFVGVRRWTCWPPERPRYRAPMTAGVIRQIFAGPASAFALQASADKVPDPTYVAGSSCLRLRSGRDSRTLRPTPYCELVGPGFGGLMDAR